jgi:hypothetical protein
MVVTIANKSHHLEDWQSTDAAPFLLTGRQEETPGIRVTGLVDRMECFQGILPENEKQNGRWAHRRGDRAPGFSQRYNGLWLCAHCI